MAQILPITELRDTNKIDQLCYDTNEPIFITKNGYGRIVVMSMETYEKKLAQIDIYNNVMLGLAQIDNNQTVDGKQFHNELRAKYGQQ